MKTAIGDYGRMVFEIFLGDRSRHLTTPDHWESIRKEAEPLVRKLLALNSKMTNGGYHLYDYHDETGKLIRLPSQRIELAMIYDLQIPAQSLKVGDKIWAMGDYIDITPDCHPATVKYIEGEGDAWVAGVDTFNGVLQKVTIYDKILLMPEGWNGIDETYWLKRADEIGL
jgi:hypothetical protein